MEFTEIDSNLGVDPQELSTISNPLAREIERRIKESGPMPFDQYMDIWNNGLIMPEGVTYPGFYNSPKTSIGSYEGVHGKGEYDFSTFPEISLVYGFLWAKQIAQMWELMDKDLDFQIVEMGGGNGTMAHDIIRGLKFFAPDSHIKYTTVEQSPILARKQRERLAELGVEVIEGSALESLPQDVTGVIISNELLDDLPAKILRKHDEGWEELTVVEGDENRFELGWVQPGEDALRYAETYFSDVQEGEECPIGLGQEKLAFALNNALKKGFIITADYYNLPGDKKIYSEGSANRVVLDSSGSIDMLSKANTGKVNITHTPDFKAFAETGRRLGIKVEGDVTVGGYVFGLDMEGEVKKFERMRKEEREAITGERFFDAYSTRTKLRTSSQRILIQSRGVDMSDRVLGGAKYRYYDGIADGEKFYRDRFVPVGTE
jgi:SAM-dependent MidA family methyltransferase